MLYITSICCGKGARLGASASLCKANWFGGPWAPAQGLGHVATRGPPVLHGGGTPVESESSGGSGSGATWGRNANVFWRVKTAIVKFAALQNVSNKVMF